MTYKTKPGASSEIRINVLDELPEHRYVEALKRIRGLIANGKPLEAFDDDAPGNKDMGCTWGFCQEDKETWPDAQDHIFPVDFEKEGRMSPLDGGERLCPLDRRTESNGSGCFYTCRVFQASKRDPAPTRDEALALYDKAIHKAGA